MILFHHRFNISYQEDRDEEDGVEYDSEENGRPSFLSIEKSAGFLDKELAASGFTKRDQDEIEKVCWYNVLKNSVLLINAYWLTVMILLFSYVSIMVHRLVYSFFFF